MNRSFPHWTPRYIKNKLAVFYEEKMNPQNPWLTKDAINFLDQTLRPSDVGIEFGSGRSTVWLAKRLSHLISVEDSGVWYGKVLKLIEKNGVSLKVDYRKLAADKEYVGQALELKDGSMDFCLVDGIARDSCALSILPKLTSGGILTIVNINLFLPNISLSPKSKKNSDLCETEFLEKFLNFVEGWRRRWTSNGVWDT